MSQPEKEGLVLVTGATGRHGGTSAYVVRSLIDKGNAVRVLARTRSERTEALAALGAEIVLGDYNDQSSLLAAFDGVDTATFTYPIADGIIPAAASFAAAARAQNKRPRIVVMSMAVSHSASPSHLGRAQWLAEEVLMWSGLDVCILRVAALFFENIVALHAHSVRENDSFGNSFADAPVPWISGLDAARLVLAAVLQPDMFSSPAVHYPPGAELRTHREIAALLSETLGRPIRFDSLTQQEWTASLVALAFRDQSGVVNPDMAKHISAVGAALASAKAPIRPPDAAELQRLTGEPPLSLHAFLANHRHAFEQLAFTQATRPA